MHRFTFHWRKQFVGVNSFFVTMKIPIICDVFSWNIMCNISYGIIYVFFSECLFWINSVQFTVHSYIRYCFVFIWLCFVFSESPSMGETVKKKHQNSSRVNTCYEIMCCMKLLLVNCIIRRESILQWQDGRCKEESIQNSLNWKKNLLF